MRTLNHNQDFSSIFIVAKLHKNLYAYLQADQYWKRSRCNFLHLDNNLNTRAMTPIYTNNTFL